MRRGLTWILCGVLITGLYCTDALAIVPAKPFPDRSEAVRRLIETLGTGREALLAVRLRDQSVVSGYVAETGTESFMVVDPGTGSAKSVPYALVARLHGYNLSSGAEVRAGAGVGSKLRSALASLLPARPPAVSHFSRTRTLIVGIIIGVVLAIVLVKTV